MRSLSISLIVLNLMFSMNSFGQNDLDDEARAKAELEAQETAMAQAQKQFATPVPVPAPVDVKTPDPVAPAVQPLAQAQPSPPVVSPNNLTLFLSSLPWGKKNTSTLYRSQTPYRINRHHAERLGSEEGDVFKCPIKDHGFHFIDNRSRGLVLTDNKTKHVDLPPLSVMAIEARDYVLGLTQRENLEIRMWTRGYVITEAGTGLVLTVEIKD